VKRAVLAALCVLAGCGGTHHKPAPPERSPFLGVVAEDTFQDDADDRRAAFERQARAGIGLVRQPFNWGLVERSPGHFDFSRIDAWVADAAHAGMHVLPILYGTPDSRSTAPTRGPIAHGAYPPADVEAFARFAAAAVHRYGPGGPFWRDHDGPPITAWQVWNEPNLPQFWASGPDPSAYARLLRAASAAIHRADPHARVVSAGLSQSSHGMPFERFLHGMYAAGAADAVDVVAVHPYAPDAAGTLRGTVAARLLVPARTPLWVTEFGWASGGPASRFTTDEQGQAERVREGVRLLTSRREGLNLAGIVYYDWRDRPPSADQSEFFGLHTGLLRLDGSAKPALAALSRP
jgi:hypothetical protein